MVGGLDSGHPGAQALAKNRAVICVDGIVTSVYKRLAPDISWGGYVSWLTRRRPDLDVVHLSQPHDWLEIITHRALSYNELVSRMVDEALAKFDPHWDQVVILGFSLGGLTALRVAHEVAQRAQSISLDYAVYVTMGSPFAGTGRSLDRLFQRLPFDYFNQMFDLDANQRYLRELTLYARHGKLRVLIGNIAHDEIVSKHSALMPLKWLEEWQPDGDFAYGTFTIRNRSALIRNHDGLLYDSQAVGFIDGMVDGLLPPDTLRPYEPFDWREMRRSQGQDGPHSRWPRPFHALIEFASYTCFTPRC